MFGRRARREPAQNDSTASTPFAAAIRGYAKLALAPSEKRSRVFAAKLESLALQVEEFGHDEQEARRAAQRLEADVESFAAHQREEVERTLALLDQGVRSAFGSLDLSVRSGEALAAAASVACENLDKLDSARSYEELRRRLEGEIGLLKEAIQRQAAASKEARKALAAQAEHTRERLDDSNAMGRTDFLTNLQNRSDFEERVRDAEEPGRWIVARVDLDGFQGVNARFGFAAGDAALVEIGSRLEAAFRGLGHVARWQGDAFAVLVKDKEPHVLTRLRTVEAELTARPVQYGGTRLPLGMSFGTAELNPRTPEVSMEEADRRRLLYKSTKSNRRAA